MNIRELKDSLYLKKEDCSPPILVTISGGEIKNLAMEGEAEKKRFCLFFEEMEKPLVCNSTNAQIIASICGSEETDDWTGHKIVLYSDPNISFQGRLTGGIRARAPRNQTQAKPATKPAPVQEAPQDPDDTPF